MFKQHGNEEQALHKSFEQDTAILAAMTGSEGSGLDCLIAELASTDYFKSFWARKINLETRDQ